MAAKVNIIGAGLAGLSAGIYLQEKEFDTEIFELAPWAGGMCTAWMREGYRFDGCIHWMVGTRPGDPIHKLYREVEALGADTPIYHAKSVQMEIDGVVYEVPFEFDLFRSFLFTHGKGDEKAIEAFLRDVKAVMGSEMPMNAPQGIGEALHMLAKSRGFLRIAMKYTGRTVEEYLEGMRDGLVKKMLFQLMPPHFSAVALLMMLGTRMSGNAGYPMGGALMVTRRMVDKYKALGGKIHFGARVEKIAVENGAARGVKAKGEFHPSDYVIAACDAYDTLNNMLGGKYPHPQLDGLLKDAPVFEPLAIVSFGLDRRMGIPFSATYESRDGIATSPDTTEHSIFLRSFDFDKDAAPVGSSSVMAMVGAPLSYWQDLRKADPKAYREEKQKLADAVANEVEKRYPGFKQAIRVTDVSTPATYVRLANVYKGSYEGFSPVPSLMKVNIQKTLPGVDRLYLCGQWTTVGGGICTAVNDGKKVANLIAKVSK